MHVVIWRFTTNHPAAFEDLYGPDGTWAQLFRHSSGYVRTDLLKGADAYLTLDWWASSQSYDEFRHEHANDYAAIDALCEAVTVTEEKVGEFVVIRGA